MNIQEITQIVERINKKLGQKAEFEALKKHIDDRTNPLGVVAITIEQRTFDADPVSIKKILDDKIAQQDTQSDETELKIKAK
jgi:hypothetical protein